MYAEPAATNPVVIAVTAIAIIAIIVIAIIAETRPQSAFRAFGDSRRMEESGENRQTKETQGMSKLSRKWYSFDTTWR